MRLPGTPVLRYGEEIGMGDDLTFRSEMHCELPCSGDGTPSTASPAAEQSQFAAPLITEGPYAYQKVNVTNQHLDPHSLLTWFERTLHALRECEEIGSGDPPGRRRRARPTSWSTAPPAAPAATLFVHNLADRPMPPEPRSFLRDPEQPPLNFVADADYGKGRGPGRRCDVAVLLGYRWIRLRRTIGS